MNLQKPIPVYALILTSLVAGCETTDPPSVVVMPDSRLAPAMRLVDDSDCAMPKIIEVKVPVPSPQLRPIGTDSATRMPLTGAAAIASAKAGATTQPNMDDFLNAIQYYDYAPGVVYTAITCPGYVITIALRPGEKLITAAA